MATQPQRVKALWDYNPSDGNELRFLKGDIIGLIAQHNKDWWEGELKGQRGYFPANRVEVIVEPPVNMSTKPTMSSASKRQSDVVNPLNMPQMEIPVNAGQPKPSGRRASEQIQQPQPAPGDMPNVQRPSNAMLAELAARSKTPTPRPSSRDATVSPKMNVAASLTSKESSSPASIASKRLSVAENKGSFSMPPQSLPAGAFALPGIASSMSSSTGGAFGGASSYNPGTSFASTDEDDEMDGVATDDAPPVASVVKAGMLSRGRGDSSATLKSNKSIYVELAQNNIYFYKDSQAKKKDTKRDKPMFILDLKGAKIDCSGNLDKKRSVFAIQNAEGHVLLLQAASEQERQSWSDAILESSGARQEVLNIDAITSAKPEKQKKAKKQQAGDEDSVDQEAAKTKLKGFFKNRPTEQKLKERGIIRQDIAFGGLLELQVKAENKKVPSIVETCIAQVELKGMDSVGIYRLSGNAASIQKFRVLYNEDPSKIDYSAEEWSDISIITGSLKLYFRELQNPLMTFERYDAFINAGKISDYQQRFNATKQAIAGLPRPYFDTLKYLAAHLQRVSKRSEQNKMDTNNLAIVFGPTLIRAQVEGMEMITNMSYQNCVMEMIIANADKLF
ncbi:hypothetical protein MIR68_000540 [Amoeboaphelidium protococcarum]|nr:hypothetical protein MIR68_000540 [Amoeboaphelidium protococcarum]